jgi:hypothetical protein
MYGGGRDWLECRSHRDFPSLDFLSLSSQSGLFSQPKALLLHTIVCTPFPPFAYALTWEEVPALASMSEDRIPDEADTTEAPLTMAASIVLTNLPRDASQALENAGNVAVGKSTSHIPPLSSTYPYILTLPSPSFISFLLLSYAQ